MGKLTAKQKHKMRSHNKRKAAYNERMKVENGTTAGRSGNGGIQDRGAGQRINNNTSHPLDRSRGVYARSQEWANLYQKEWTAKKIVQIPVDDMLRNRWEYDNLEDEAQEVLDLDMKRVRFDSKLRNALRLERLLGGCILFMGVRDDTDDPSVPLDPTKIGKGDLQFVNVIPRTRLSHTSYDNDPFSETFGSPNSYHIYGHEIHVSRLLVFNGDPLTENPRDDFTYQIGNRDGMGESVLAPIYDDIMRSMGTRQAGYHLIQRASVLLINNQNMQGMLEGKGGKQALAKLDEITDQLDIYQAAMIDGKKVTLDQWSANFGSVPQLLEQYLQIISAGSDIPATRFLGQAPGGLNATGTSDLENYYNMIDSRRETSLRDNLEKFFNIQMRSTFGDKFEPEMLCLTFPPLWNLSETEEAGIRSTDAAFINAAFNSGQIDANFANKEMKERDIWLTDPEGDMLEDEDLDIDANAGRSSADILDALKGTEAVPEKTDDVVSKPTMNAGPVETGKAGVDEHTHTADFKDGEGTTSAAGKDDHTHKYYRGNDVTGPGGDDNHRHTLPKVVDNKKYED